MTDVAASPVRFMLAEPVVCCLDGADGRPAVVLWLEAEDGRTLRLGLPLDDARDLIRQAAEAVEAFD